MKKNINNNNIGFYIALYTPCLKALPHYYPDHWAMSFLKPSQLPGKCTACRQTCNALS